MISKFLQYDEMDGWMDDHIVIAHIWIYMVKSPNSHVGVLLQSQLWINQGKRPL